MTVPKASSTPTHPVATPAGLGKVWPKPSIEDTGQCSAGSLGAWRRIHGVSGQSKRPRPTPNSA